MTHQTLFKNDVLCVEVINMRGQIVRNINKKLKSGANDKSQDVFWLKRKAVLKEFNASVTQVVYSYALSHPFVQAEYGIGSIT